MKIATLLLLSMCVGTSAFVAKPGSPTVSSAVTSLEVASIPPEDLDNWSNKPLHVHKSTTPVADPKFNMLGRMMMKDVVLPPNYSLTWVLALCGPLIMAYHPCRCPSFPNVVFSPKISNHSICPLIKH
jgi:hypothetical protein